MKLILSVVCLFALSATCKASEAFERMKAEVKGIAMECTKDVGATDDDVSNFMSHVLPDSHEAHCMLFCIGKRTGFFNEDGSYDETGLESFLQPLKTGDPELYASALAVNEKCRKEVSQDPDPCTTAANFYQCCISAEKEMM